MTLISVIIPVFNTEVYLNECIDTILGQTFSDFELICVDDGSTDKSRQILESYAKQDDRIRVLYQSKKFAGSARNFGLSIARGDYVIFLDSDDFFEIDMLENLYQKAHKFDADICVCDAKNYIEKTGLFNTHTRYLDATMIPKKEPFSYETNPKYIFNFTNPAPWNMLFKRRFLVEQHLTFQEIERSNDLRFYGFALAKASSIVTVKSRYVNYRVRESGNLQSHNDITPLCFYDALMQIKDELIKMGTMEQLKLSFMNLAVNIYIYNIEKLKDPKNYRLLHSKFINEAMKDFYFEEFSEELFYIKKYKIKFYQLIESDIEDILNKMYHEKEHENHHKILFSKQKEQSIVSVIIPVYNTGKYLRECIESVVAQTLTDIEIICINDGSTDNSMDILREYAEIENRILLVDSHNGGPSKARNIGLNIARGKYIIFLDSDDTLVSNALEKLLIKAEGDNLEIVYFNTKVLFLDSEVNEKAETLERYYKRVRDYRGVMEGIDLFVMMTRVKEYLPSACLQFFQHEFLNRIGTKFYEGIIHEDNLFTFQTMIQAKRVGYSLEKLYNRTVHNESIMTKKINRNNFVGYFTCYVEMFITAMNYEKQNLISEETSGRMWSHVQNVYNSATGVYRKLPKKEIIKISFRPNSIEEKFYMSFAKSELELRRTKKSKYYSTGKELFDIAERLKGKNRIIAAMGRRSFTLLRRFIR